MIRWAVVGLAGLVAGVLVAPICAAATPGVKATLTSKVPLGAAVGTRFALTWTMTRPGGKPYSAKGIFVRVVCPEGDVITRAPATVSSSTKGAYRAVVAVPAGGIGVISIGAGTPPSYFAITNPVHR
jgi:hypothetical protein